MDFKKLTLDFYRAVRRLPNYGKVMAAASVASLYLAINPAVHEEFNNPKGEVFLLYNVTNRMQYKEWIVALNKYLKNRQRKKMTLSFLFCAGICFSSDPDLIRRLRALIPKKL